MKEFLYAIKDDLSGFAAPMEFLNDEIADRWFKDHVTKNEYLSNNAKDFSLWKLGEADTDKGTITGYPEAELKLIRRANDYEICKPNKTE